MMEGLLKGSCDACTASKVKCSGGNPCKRCAARDSICSYRPKRKRGPQKGHRDRPVSHRSSSNDDGDSHESNGDGDEGFTFISSYERRVWSVFFTMFKNQNRSRNDAPWAFCWFLSQLDKLKAHLERSGNTGALKRLRSWLDALDVDLEAVAGGMSKRCSFDASVCGSCAATAMCAPNAAGEGLAAMAVRSGGRLIEALQVGAQFSLGAVDDETPRVVVLSSGDGVRVEANAAFHRHFGYTGADFERMLAWSAGGFLPWGGDVLAKLVVKESDLHVFLQILAIKFQALGPPQHDSSSHAPSEREVPSTHIFDLWCAGETAVCTYMLRCVHLERVMGSEMNTQLKISFEKVADPKEPPAGTQPVSFEAPPQALVEHEHQQRDGVAKRTRRQQVRTSPRSLTLGSSSSSAPPPPSQQQQQQQQQQLPEDAPFGRVDTLPPEFAEYYDNWAVFDALEPAAGAPPPPPESSMNGLSSFDHMGDANKSDAPEQPQQDERAGPPAAQPTAGGLATMRQESLAGDFLEDGDWLNSILEWSASNNNMTTA